MTDERLTELREQIARVIHKAIRQFEVEKCPEVFDLKVHIDQVLALIPDEEEWFAKGIEYYRNLILPVMVEGAKKQERERTIAATLAELEGIIEGIEQQFREKVLPEWKEWDKIKYRIDKP